MKKLFFLFIGMLFVWQALGTAVTINITVGSKKQAQAAGETLTIDAPVQITTANYLTAQKLVDTASSTYFIDPASTGTSLMVAGSINFFDGTAQTTAAAGVPSGTVVFYNGASCPTGWTEYTAARGFTLVGLPSGGTLNGTVGTAFTNLENRTHAHTGPSHQHEAPFGKENGGAVSFPDAPFGSGGTMPGRIAYAPGTTPNLSTNYWLTSSAGNANTGTAATSNVMPYLQLLVCQKS